MDYSDEILEETPQSVAELLNGIGPLPTVRTLLANAGMTDGDIVEGRTTLLDCLAAPRTASAQADTDGAKEQRDATAELDAWDEPDFERFEATLRRHYPSARDHVFDNLAASTGAKAVAGVATFLGRPVALEKGSDPARAASKTDDKAAVKLLAKRGLDGAERARLQGRVEIALGPTSPLDAPVADPGKRREKLVLLRGWFDEWSSTVRAVVKKRGYLIRLGVATRKAGNEGRRTAACRPAGLREAAGPARGAAVGGLQRSAGARLRVVQRRGAYAPREGRRLRAG